MGLMKLVLGLFAAYMYSDLRIAGTSWYWTPLLVLAILLYSDPREDSLPGMGGKQHVH